MSARQLTRESFDRYKVARENRADNSKYPAYVPICSDLSNIQCKCTLYMCIVHLYVHMIYVFT